MKFAKGPGRMVATRTEHHWQRHVGAHTVASPDDAWLSNGGATDRGFDSPSARTVPSVACRIVPRGD